MRKCFTIGGYSNYVSKEKMQARYLQLHLPRNSIFVTYTHTHTPLMLKKKKGILHTKFSSVQLLSRVRLFVTP